MTDGLHAESRMLGDVKFHQHQEVDAGVAERWREELPARTSWARSTRELAARLGYEIAAGARLVADRAARDRAGRARCRSPSPRSASGSSTGSTRARDLQHPQRPAPLRPARRGPPRRRADGGGAPARGAAHHLRRGRRAAGADRRGRGRAARSTGSTSPPCRRARATPRPSGGSPAEVERPFDLARGPLLRALLLRLARRSTCAC